MPTDVVAQGASLPDWRGRRPPTGPTSRRRDWRALLGQPGSAGPLRSTRPARARWPTAAGRA